MLRFARGGSDGPPQRHTVTSADLRCTVCSDLRVGPRSHRPTSGAREWSIVLPPHARRGVCGYGGSPSDRGAQDRGAPIFLPHIRAILGLNPLGIRSTSAPSRPKGSSSLASPWRRLSYVAIGADEGQGTGDPRLTSGDVKARTTLSRLRSEASRSAWRSASRSTARFETSGRTSRRFCSASP